jgi:hypothetical protein
LGRTLEEDKAWQVQEWKTYCADFLRSLTTAFMNKNDAEVAELLKQSVYLEHFEDVVTVMPGMSVKKTFIETIRKNKIIK